MYHSNENIYWRPLMFRRLLNIASITCFITCLVLVGLCVRSYSRLDWYGFGERDLASNCGLIVWGHVQGQANPRGYDSGPAEETFLGRLEFGLGLQPVLGFGAAHYRNESVIVVPDWFLVLTTGAAAMLLRTRWPWRFYLGAMLVVTTLVAIVLGMIACIPKSWPSN